MPAPHRLKVQEMMLQMEELKAKCQGLEDVQNLKAVYQELQVEVKQLKGIVQESKDDAT